MNPDRPISALFAENRPLRSLEFFPPKDDAGVEALKARGNLSPEEIHKLAHKGKKADCHSDVVKDAEAILKAGAQPPAPQSQAAIDKHQHQH